MMLTIRLEQMAAFAQAAERDFEDRAIAHLRSVIPVQCDTIGNDILRASIRFAIRKGRFYGLVEEYDLLRYLNLMFALGFEFDAELTWARDLLERRDLDPRTRMTMLTRQAKKRISEPVLVTSL